MATSTDRRIPLHRLFSELIDTVVEWPEKSRRVPPRRAYHSPLRADQAQQTRRRVLEAARRLFVDRGYAGTTVAAVADHAGVSPETIYLSLGGKRGLLEGVMDITGPHDTAADDEKWWPTDRRIPGAPERLEKIVEYSCGILARTWPIHAIIRGAADKEAFAAAFGQRLLEERLANQTERIRQYLAGDLRPGLSAVEAGSGTASSPVPSSSTCSPSARLDRRPAPVLAHRAPVRGTLGGTTSGHA